ncbi:hypothetical protein JTB14_019596 [Gonioctena quinquepunctata]|nr:hypothetical protein JTB14_019596 [Gonioctena quinquepunctata]
MRVGEKNESSIKYRKKIFKEPDIQPITYEPNDWVMVKNSKNARNNFGATWVGPYQVSSKIGENCYVVNKGGIDLNIHVDDIRKRQTHVQEANLDPRPEPPN